MSEEFDIFLSHSSADKEAAEGLVSRWEAWDFKVFADFKDEVLLKASEENRVDAEVAEVLRKAIRACRIFVFVASRKSIRSGWMPWELGLAHGAVGRVHIYRLDRVDLSKVRGREYASLYSDNQFDETGAREYLERVVAEAKRQPANDAQLEAARDMAQRALDAMREFRLADAQKELSESPLVQGRETMAGLGSPSASSAGPTSSFPTPWSFWWPLKGK
jgi:TIR domain-containing protein